jgi:hypothetical protein
MIKQKIKNFKKQKKKFKKKYLQNNRYPQV